MLSSKHIKITEGFLSFVFQAKKWEVRINKYFNNFKLFQLLVMQSFLQPNKILINIGYFIKKIKLLLNCAELRNCESSSLAMQLFDCDLFALNKINHHLQEQLSLRASINAVSLKNQATSPKSIPSKA